MTNTNNFTRRRLLGGLLGAGALGGLGALALRPGVARSGQGLRAGDDPGLAERKLLFVVCATGGGNIVDSFLPVLDSEVTTGDPAALDVYPESLIVQPPGSNIRCVGTLSNYSYFTNNFSMQTLLANHYADMVVLGHECTSVNHTVAQKRALTGAGVNLGRTIMEANAERHGSGLLLPNTNMANGGYIAPGDDPDLPRWARAELIADPLMFAASTHGRRGVAGAPDSAKIDRARKIRGELEQVSPFGQTFGESPLRQQYLEQRDISQPAIEAADLISKLMLVPQDNLPAEYGLEASPLVDPIHQAFPLLYQDAWEAQASLAFALAYFGVSCSVSVGLDFDPAATDNSLISTPLAFDYSHNDHRVAQNLMWGRTSRLIDGLVTLLKTFDYLGDPALGKMWDRSLIYVATDFGREKIRPGNASSWGTGHHLNNGALLVSPLLKGNAVYGGIDPNTLLTYGFDRATGEPDPGTIMREGDVYSAIATALGIEFGGRRDMSVMMRG
ncbi:hypothetical protein ACNOYE_30575 [Nannocystaceae bacterium ST9]